jgi:MoaE-MoaD fusion protein
MDGVVIVVRLFAALRERAGRESVVLELDDGATVTDALSALSDRGGLGGLLDRTPVVMAVNREYADGDRELREGDEVALIPPVSGGAGEIHVRVTGEAVSLESLARMVGRPGAGAIVTFQGTTRDVARLDYEAYAEMAEDQIAGILRDCVARHGLEAAAVEHRIGAVPLGEASVVVAVSAPHRAEAFAGAREAIDRIKAQAPIWKREVEGAGAAERARWVKGSPPARPARSP